MVMWFMMEPIIHLCIKDFKSLFLKKWQLAKEFSVCKVNCDGNTLSSSAKKKKRVEDFTIFLKSTMYLLKNFALVN